MGKIRYFGIPLLFKIGSVISFLTLLTCYLAPLIHPDTIFILPFLGLAYPIIIIINVLILIVWLVFRSKWALVSLAVILIGGKLHFRAFALTLFEDSKKQNELKVLSYNVRLFDIYNPSREGAEATRNKIFSYIRSENPDVLCIQEFYRQDHPTDFPTIDSIYSIMGTTIYHERSAYKRHAHQNFGIALFSKYPMIAKGDVMFDAQSSEDFNYCIYADIVKDSDTFRFYNVHFQSIKFQSDYYQINPGDPIDNLTDQSTIKYMLKKLHIAYQKRADQARRVSEHAKTSPYPTIICGDFNDTPLSYTYNQFNRTLTDAFRNTSIGIGSTYIGKLPAGRIDYIFHSPELASYEFKIQKEEFSDHRAISCKISK
jgi:endonuclease/exonuclease/phosphatase family metal-dependent hydrolase